MDAKVHKISEKGPLNLEQKHANKKKNKQYFAKQENLCTFAAHDWMILISCLKIHIIYINSKEQ